MNFKNRLLNKLFEDKTFLVDEESIPYIVRDIINMNWWNTCGYLLGYQKGRRVSLEYPTKQMKLIGCILKEFYRHDKENNKSELLFNQELKQYINKRRNDLPQLRLFSIKYRRNDSQYYYKDGEPTWLDCTSRATYAWKYVGQNGYMDFDGKCRVIDGMRIVKHCQNGTAYNPNDKLFDLFAEGENLVKKEIFSQRKTQLTVGEWVKKLGINMLPSRVWLYENVKDVKTDPCKNNEKELLKRGELRGTNECHYGYKTMASNASAASYASAASNASYASAASDASRASNASNASNASRASDASAASNASRASAASDASAASATNDKFVTKEKQSWFNVPSALGAVPGLEHPPMFLKNKFGVAGHWKINKELVGSCKLGWFDPFMGHGESPLFAKRIGKNFYGIEINPDSMSGYLLPFVQKAVNLWGDKGSKVEIKLGDSSIFDPNLVGRFDLCYTSPPYFDFEDYGFHNKTILDCKDYDEFHERVTRPVFKNVHKYLIKDGILALQTEKDKNLKKKWVEVIKSLGFEVLEDTITGQEKNKYSQMSKRDQTLLIFKKVDLN